MSRISSSPRRTIATLLVILLIIALGVPARARSAQATVRYAAPAALGVGDCSAWAHACALQAALAAAQSGEQIWVQAGLYKPTTTSDRDIAFVLKHGVAIYGGFAGTESQISQRDLSTNLSVLSGDIDNNDTTDASGVVTIPTNIQGQNSKSIISATNIDGSVVLDGFVITAAQSSGMRSTNSSPTLRNLTFSGNIASQGGGLFNEGSGSPSLSNVTFSANQAGNGGGMFSDSGGNPSLSDVTFVQNRADNYGGGFFNRGANTSLNNVYFDRNSSYGGGAGMMNEGGSPTLRNVTFSGNRGYSGNGGGLYNSNGSPSLVNVIFSNNKTFAGGGIFSTTSSSPTLTNILFSGNEGTFQGGGMFNGGTGATLINVTFSGNTSPKGGGISNTSGSLTLTNSIFWGNTGASAAQIFNGASITIRNSIVQGSGGSGSGWNSSLGTDGGGNQHADPLFIDADGADNAIGTADDNLRLRVGSPALDAGLNSALPASVGIDLGGGPRISGGTVDMGAYEGAIINSNGSTGGPGSAFAFSTIGFAPGAKVSISVTPPASQAASLAAASYVIGHISADANGVVTFAVRLGGTASAGVYTITASDGILSASAEVTLSTGAPVVSAPAGVLVLSGQHTVYLPLVVR